MVELLSDRSKLISAGDPETAAEFGGHLIERDRTYGPLPGTVRLEEMIGDARADGGGAAEPVWRPWETVDFEADPDWEWRTAADDSPEELYGFWRGAVEWARAAWAAALADGGLDQPSKFTTDDGESPNLRRLLVDLHDEYARHTGHADLLREAVDGLVGEDLPQPA